MHILVKAPDQKCQKPKHGGWDRLLSGCLAEARRGGPTSDGALLHRWSVGRQHPQTFRFSEEAWCTGLALGTGAWALGGEPGLEAGGRLFLNLSSACPHVLRHEALWAAGSSSFGSCQGVLEHRPLTKLGKPKQRKT